MAKFRTKQWMILGWETHWIPVRPQDGDWHGTRGRLWLSEDAIDDLVGMKNPADAVFVTGQMFTTHHD